VATIGIRVLSEVELNTTRHGDRISESEKVMGQGLDKHAGQQVEARFKQAAGTR
jgi:hypothetical protein